MFYKNTHMIKYSYTDSSSKVFNCLISHKYYGITRYARDKAANQ